MIDQTGLALAPVQGRGVSAGSVEPGSGAISPAGGAAGDFASMLSSFLSETIGNVRSGEIAAVDGMTGKIPLQDVVNKVMTAEQSLQAALAVRDKIVAAYQEVSRMSI